MTSRRSKRKRDPDAPLTGVASGGLGTAANLDDTKVMKISELEASAQPSPPRDDAPASADQAPTMAVRPAKPALRPRPSARLPTSPLRTQRLPALAGAIAVVVLLVVAGAGFLSQLDLGTAGVLPAETGAAAPTATEAVRTSAPKDKGGGHGGCRGRGHGNDCGGGD